MAAQQSHNFAAVNQKTKETMRTANNTNNYTVEGLVAKYRNFVKENCPKELVTYPVDNKIIEDKVPNEFGAIETLLLSLYKSAAGNNVNHYIVEALEKYLSYCKENYTNALTDDEYDFLVKHFSAQKKRQGGAPPRRRPNLSAFQLFNL